MKNEILLEKLQYFLSYWPNYSSQDYILRDIEMLIDSLKGNHHCNSGSCEGKMIFMDSSTDFEIYKCSECGREEHFGFN